MKNINCREARQIPISDYLKKLGFVPAYTRGNDYWYCSPLREEKHASFKVNTRLNLWYDHGTGEGGTMIDLGIKLHECSIEELLKKLSGDERSFSFHQPKLMSDLNHLIHSNPKQEEESKIIIDKVAELKSFALISYLDQRGISQETAKWYCKEVSFTIKDRSYQHACLKYVSNEKMTNQSLRERFKIEVQNYSIASRIIRDAIEEGVIKEDDPTNKSRKYASYIPIWA